MYVSQHEGWVSVHPGQPNIEDKLPVGVYKVGYDMQRGFMLLPSESESAIMSAGNEMLGSMAGKEAKIIDAYRRRSTSTGVLLSGDRGLGKTMLLRKVAKLAMTDLKIPVIVLSTAYSGVAEFLAVVNQEYMLVLDELEKVFFDKQDQDALLTVLDGVCSYKRLVVATCNDTGRLTEHLFGRPNRFYYHLCFDYPTFDEAVEYLKSRGAVLDDDRREVLQMETLMHPYNYDILSALAEELKAGYPLGETLDDLNAELSTGDVRLDVEVELDGGAKVHGATWVRCTMIKPDQTFTVALYTDGGQALPDNHVSMCVKGISNGEIMLDVVECRETNTLNVTPRLAEALEGSLNTYDDYDGDAMVRVVSAKAVPSQSQWQHRARSFR